MIHLSTIKLLREWARWGEANNIDFPSMSPMFGERTLKTPLFSGTDIPTEVARIELAVCRVTVPERIVIVAHYQRRRTIAHLGRTHRLTWWKARHLLQSAERAVDHEYSKIVANYSNQAVYSRPDSKTVSAEPA